MRSSIFQKKKKNSLIFFFKAFNKKAKFLKNTVNGNFFFEYGLAYNVDKETQANRIETVFFFDEKRIIKILVGWLLNKLKSNQI